MTRHQAGYIWRVGRSWYGRWYRDQIVDGAVVRCQHSEKLCAYSDRYRSKKDVKPLLAEKLAPVNEGRCSAESTLTVVKYVEQFFLPYAEAELKPSTVHGYKGLWRMYVKPRAADITLRDFRCVDATNILAAIHREHGLSRKSLRHCKSLLGSIFTHAKRAGVIDENPIRDAGIPRRAEKAEPTVAYSPQDVLEMLHTLTGVARAAVALMFFAGLRPGEARAAQWADYDADKRILRVKSSMWRTVLGTPKTEQSCGFVPMAQVLADTLADLPRISQFILAGPSGKPVDLHNLAARVVSPALQRCAICHEAKAEHAEAEHPFELDKSLPLWRGWYALRRGLATAATTVDSAIAAKSLLRHSNIATTNQHYIKSVPAEAIRAVDKINALFDNAGASGRPN